MSAIWCFYSLSQIKFSKDGLRLYKTLIQYFSNEHGSLPRDLDKALLLRKDVEKNRSVETYKISCFLFAFFPIQHYIESFRSGRSQLLYFQESTSHINLYIYIFSLRVCACVYPTMCLYIYGL